jgi:predicted  nucleic acid-binding Zn-ribbon protein
MPIINYKREIEMVIEKKQRVRNRLEGKIEDCQKQLNQISDLMLLKEGEKEELKKKQSWIQERIKSMKQNIDLIDEQISDCAEELDMEFEPNILLYYCHND